MSAASHDLLAQSSARRSAGELDRAAELLERALRIDPSAAELWIALGEVRNEQGRPAQASALARKALLYVGDDAGLRRRAQLLLEASRPRA